VDQLNCQQQVLLPLQGLPTLRAPQTLGLLLLLQPYLVP
jgi:hypothetical protein